MKKKFWLLLAMTLMLLCFFAISVSATYIFKDIDGNELVSYERNADKTISSYTGTFPKNDGEGNAIVWYYEGQTTDENGNIIITVKHFKALGDDGDIKGVLDDNGWYSVSGINGTQIVSINLPDNSGIKIIDICFDGNSSASFPNESKLLFAYLPNTLEKYSESGVGWTKANIFQNTPIVECYFSNLNTDNPNHMNAIGKKDFFGCKNLRKCILPEGITSIYGDGSGNSAFAGCINLTEITIPNTVTSIGARLFDQCSSLVTVRMGANSNITSGNWLFTYTENLKCIYLSKTFVNAYSANFCHGAKDMVIFYTGNYDQYVSLNTKLSKWTNNTQFTDATPILWDESKTDQYYLDLAEAEQKCYIVYGYSDCEAFYNGHDIVTNNGQSVCSNCEKVISCLNTEHNLNIDIIYESFTSNGSKTVQCLDCSSTTVIDNLPALFTCLGYSAPEDGRGGIAIGYTVNNEAITEYETITGKTLKYGVFAVAKDKLGTNDVFAEDGTVASNTIAVEISNHGFVAFELKIIGFTDEYKDLKLAMGAYVAVTDGETTEYSYMQSGTPNDGEKYCFVSYNDIVGKPSTEEEVTQ